GAEHRNYRHSLHHHCSENSRPGYHQTIRWCPGKLPGTAKPSASSRTRFRLYWSDLAQKTVYRLRRDVDEKLARLPLKFFDAHPHGEILSRAVNDIDNLGNTLQQSGTQVITSAVTILGVLIMMLSISWQLCLMVLGTLPLSMMLSMGIARYSQNYFRQQQKALGALNGHVEEMYTCHKVVRAFGCEAKVIATFTALNE